MNVEEDLLAEVQRLPAENAYLKLASLGFRDEQRAKNAGNSGTEAEHKLDILLK